MRTTQDAQVDVRNDEERVDVAKVRQKRRRFGQSAAMSNRWTRCRLVALPASLFARATTCQIVSLGTQIRGCVAKHARRTRAFVPRASSDDARTCRCLPLESFFSRSVCHVDGSGTGRPTPPRRVTASAAAAATGVFARPNARLERQEKRVGEREEGDVGPTWRGNEGRRERIAFRPLVTDAADRPTCHRPAAAQERLSKPKGLNRNRNRRLSTWTFFPSCSVPSRDCRKTLGIRHKRPKRW